MISPRLQLSFDRFRNESETALAYQPEAGGHGLQTMAQAQIVIDGVSHCYRPPTGRPVLALEDVSLDIDAREFVALLGPSGCGKWTLPYLLGGFFPPATRRNLREGKPSGAPSPGRGI